MSMPLLLRADTLFIYACYHNMLYYFSLLAYATDDTPFSADYVAD